MGFTKVAQRIRRRRVRLSHRVTLFVRSNWNAGVSVEGAFIASLHSARQAERPHVRPGSHALCRATHTTGFLSRGEFRNARQSIVVQPPAWLAAQRCFAE